MHYAHNRTLERCRTRDTNLPKKRRNAQKMVILTKESKNFIKVDGLQKLHAWACLFYDFLRFKGWPYINHKISLSYDLYFDHFFGFSYPFHDANSYGSTIKIPSISDVLNSNLRRVGVLERQNLILFQAQCVERILNKITKPFNKTFTWLKYMLQNIFFNEILDLRK